jgi:hypothetical protein
MTDSLYAAYRHYAYVKTCHERRGWWTTYISDAELDRAKDKILIIETDTLAWLNDAWEKDQNVDTDSLFNKAVDSLNGVVIDEKNCHSELVQLFQTKSSAGKVDIKKDF